MGDTDRPASANGGLCERAKVSCYICFFFFVLVTGFVLYELFSAEHGPDLVLAAIAYFS
jgi:hypothetical protein